MVSIYIVGQYGISARLLEAGGERTMFRLEVPSLFDDITEGGGYTFERTVRLCRQLADVRLGSGVSG